MIVSLIILALILEGFFSGSETALVSVNLMKLRHMVEKKNKRAQIAYRLMIRPDYLLATTLIGTNIAVVTSSALATFLFSQSFHGKGELIAVCVMTPLALIFGEIIPKSVFREHSTRLVLKVAPALKLFQNIFKPAIIMISGIAKSLISLVSSKTTRKNPFVTREEIKLLIREIAREGILEEQEKEVIDNIFDFTLTRVEDVMVHLKNIVCVNFTNKEDDIREKSKKCGFTRLPVFKGKKLIGVINIFDIFYNEGDWRNYIRPLRKVNMDERLDEIFSKMRPNRESMAAVIKNNKVVGIFTMEDLMEEIVCGIIEPSKATEK